MNKEIDALPKDLALTIQRWAGWTIFALKKSIQQKKIKGSGLLKNSFTYKLTYGADGMPTKVSIGFNFYGKFIDMGVGKGVKISDVKGNAEKWRALASDEKRGQKHRIPVKWYSPTMYYEYQRLSELLVEKYAIEIPARFEYTMAERITMNL
jgi:hypothetical protein